MDMVIIGAGECGTRAALALREAGHQGGITLLGAESSLPYERPPLSKPEGAGVVRKPICDQAAFAAAGVCYCPDTSATAIDRAARRVLTQAGPLPYDRLLIATGAKPRRPACPGAEHARAFRSHADAEAVFASATGPVAIIGAGLIGMELAAALRARDLPVTVIELGAAPMARAVPPELAARLHREHLAHGTGFRMQAGVARIAADAVWLASGERLPVVLTIAAIGVTPDTGLAQAAGLAVGNGILTDARLQTSDPAIFAAGDCAAVRQPDGSHQRQESWRSARAQAETAARSMLGGTEPHDALPWFWSDQFGLTLQVAGQPLPGHAQALRPLPGGEMRFYLDAGRLVAAAALAPGQGAARDMKLAEMLIARAARPDPAALADPAIGLKALLAARAA